MAGVSSTAALQRGDTAAQAAARGVTGPAAGCLPGPLPPLPRGSDGLSFQVTGPLSGLTGTVVVRLPPGYRSAAAARTRYPVLETFHGYPAPLASGSRRWAWAARSTAVAARRMREALIVSPQLEFPPGVDTECVNGAPGSPQVETWATRDVPSWVARTLRVDPEPVVVGHRGALGRRLVRRDGDDAPPRPVRRRDRHGRLLPPRVRPAVRPVPAGQPARPPLRPDPALALPPPPVALWLETSHTDAVLYGSQRGAAARREAPLAVDATVLQHAGHRTSLWRGLMPGALTWLGANVPGFAPR